MGFTEQEIVDLMEALGSFGQMQGDTSITYLSQWYNGYLFHAKAPSRIYNPDMVLYYFTEWLQEEEYPDKLIDLNIASDYGKIRRLFQLKDPDQNYQVIDQLIHDGFVTSQLTEQFSFERDFTQQDFISLLFYMGFISIKETQFNNLHFVIPNFVIKGLY